MKNRTRASAVTLALAIPALGLAQSIGYADADSPSEAVGMMRMSIETAELLRVRCIRHDPALQEAIDANLLKWKTTERSVLETATHHWNEMLKIEPKLADLLKMAERALDSNLQLLSEAPGPAGGEVIRQYCVQHFEDLASGVWRVRTPKAYEYLDRAP